MIEIALVTLNSTYQHTAFGLRYLYANLQDLQAHARIFEYTIHRPAQEIADQLIEANPKIIGFGVYIWNTKQTLKVIELIKSQRPDICLVLGGPEVSFESSSQKICGLADYVICGEADFLFYEFCNQILRLDQKPVQKIIRGNLPEIKDLLLPYTYFTDNDIQNRIVYVEASRGCPYKCEYCLSSLDKSVRNFPLDRFLIELENLIERGARQFKFIDRTFNLSPSISTKILGFFLERVQLGLFLHFEMVPDRLPDELKFLIQKFPEGSLQFEIGVQTWNPTVAALVSRRQDYLKIQENLNFLKTQTGVHTHVDLIAGLPGESLESFALGFDALAALEPDEIQVGILKRLKGTPIIRHDQEWKMDYASEPPFQIIENKLIPAEVFGKIQRFSKFWDLIANSGNFKETMRLIKARVHNGSLFFWFWDLTDFLALRHPAGHSIHLLDLFKSLLAYFEEVCHWEMKNVLAEDYQRGRKGSLPNFLNSNAASQSLGIDPAVNTHLLALPKRQRKHLQRTEPVLEKKSGKKELNNNSSHNSKMS